MRKGTVVVVVGLALVAGCNKGKPAALPSLSPSASPTSSPTPSASPSPSPSPSVRATTSPTPSPTAARPTAPPAPTKPVGFGPAFRVGPNRCGGSQTVVDGGGRTRGFMTCEKPTRNELEYVTSAAFGGNWRLTAVGTAVRVLATADDGTATYGLFLDGEGTGVLKLIKRTRSGATKITTLDSLGASNGAALAAVQGSWWATWSRIPEGFSTPHVWEARTMGHDVAAHDTGRQGAETRMVPLSATAVEIVRSGGSASLGGGISVVRADAAGWHADHYVVGSATRSEATSQPDITRIGAVTAVSWNQWSPGGTHHIVYADDSSGQWRKHTFSAPVSDYGRGRLASSQGRVFVAWSRPVGGRAVSVHVAERFQGRWAEADLRDTPTGDYTLAALDAFEGRAQFVVDLVGDDGLVTVRVRHQ